MGQSLTPSLQVSRATTVRRVRELPVPGKVVKRVGETVRAEEVVARADLAGELYLVRISEQMGIEPDEVMQGLKVKPGDEVQSGAVLCEHAGLFGWFKTRCASPVAGRVEMVTQSTGHVGIRLAPEPITLDAYIDGTVVAVDEGKSVTIEASAALVQGIFGIGGERKGTLRVLPLAPDTKLSVAQVPADLKGQVVVAGTRPSIEVLRAAAAAGAVGWIAGAIDDRAMAEYLGFDLGIALTGDEELPMTVIVTEGFGDLGISARVFDLLRSLDGKRCSINGATQVRAGAVRPEILICGVGGAPDRDAASQDGSLRVGSRIRIIRVPWFGVSATVTALPQTPQEVATGAHARVLRAKLEGGEEITVPRANVELL